MRSRREAAARAIAITNGFDDADASEVVNVYIPADPRALRRPARLHRGPDRGDSSVGVRRDHRSRQWPVGAYAVATNDQNLTFPFSMLALDPTACKAIHVAGWRRRRGLRQHPVELKRRRLHDRPDRVQPDRWQHDRRDRGRRDVSSRRRRSRTRAVGSMTCTAAENSFALPDPLRNLAGADQAGAGRPAMVRVGHTQCNP